MESGYFNVYTTATRGIFPLIFLRWKDHEKEITERLGSTAGFLWANMDVQAYRCQNCQIVAFPYVHKEKSEFQEEAKPENYSYGDVEKYLR